MRPTADQLLEHISAHAGLADVHRITTDVLAWISANMEPAARELVAEELPEAFAEIVRTGGGRPLILRGPRYELAAAVCKVLVEELSEESLAAITPTLPPVLARLFVPPAPEGREPSEVEREHATIARGRPWPHPLAEAHPGARQHDTVEDPNPHAHSKLSSSEGLTQEREHETIAEGRLRPSRPIARG